jgi:hypothetical protein
VHARSSTLWFPCQFARREHVDDDPVLSGDVNAMGGVVDRHNQGPASDSNGPSDASGPAQGSWRASWRPGVGGGIEHRRPGAARRSRCPVVPSFTHLRLAHAHPPDARVQSRLRPGSAGYVKRRQVGGDARGLQVSSLSRGGHDDPDIKDLEGISRALILHHLDRALVDPDALG